MTKWIQRSRADEYMFEGNMFQQSSTPANKINLHDKEYDAWISPVLIEVFIHEDQCSRTTRYQSNIPEKCRKRGFPEKIW